MAEYYVADTNVLLTKIESLIDYKIVLLSHTLRELDKHKSSHNGELAYNARRAVRYIKANQDKFKFDVRDYDGSILGKEFDNVYQDNNILAACVANGNQYGLITNDVLLQYKAKGFEIDVVDLGENAKSSKEYAGILKVYVTTNSKEEELFALAYQNPSNNALELLTNQYVIFYDKEAPIEFDEYGDPIKYKVLDKLRFDGEKLVKLKLPNQKVVKARNEEQECAIDLLNNDNIPIKFIIGKTGSGKTKLSTKIGIHKVIDTGQNAKIVAMRNVIGSGEEIGFLPGDFEQKVGGFFEAIIDCLKGGELEAQLMEQRGQLEKRIPYFSKGLTFNDAYVLVDEAEDLNKKIIKLLGSRIGEQASIVFSGDYGQVEDKYVHNNGLLLAIEELKGEKLVGIVSLSEDVRSEASKLFADL